MKKLWLSWYTLLLICGILGFLPEPEGLMRLFCVAAGIVSFLPAGILLHKARCRQDTKTLRLVRNLSILSLSLTVVLYGLNVLSVLMKPVWGTVFYILLVIGSTPMVCIQYWVLGLFGWSCLLWTAISFLKTNG